MLAKTIACGCLSDNYKPTKATARGCVADRLTAAWCGWLEAMWRKVIVIVDTNDRPGNNYQLIIR